MIVLKDKCALVVKTNDPTSITNHIPTSKAVRIKDTGLFVVIPHTEDSVNQLRTLGHEAPAPIETYYKFKGRFELYPEQRKTADFLTLNKKALVLNEMGTGKTISTLVAADYKIKAGHWKKVLIVAPLSTLERVWADQIFCDFPGVKYQVLYGTKAKRLKQLKNDANYYIINHDGFKTIQESLVGQFDAILIDEVSVYKNPRTALFRLLYQYCVAHPELWVWMLTGTPTPNAPTDAWTLGKLLDNPHCPLTFNRFQDQVMRRHGPYKLVAKPNAVGDVKQILQPSIRFTRKECVSLPSTTTQTREIEMTNDQKVYFKEMLKTLIAEVNENKITATNEVHKRAKLLEICCGVMYDNKGKYIEIDAKPRMKVVTDVIEEMTGKVIIFSSRTGALKMLLRKLSKDYNCALINGEVSAKARNQIFTDFQNSDKPQVLIANPRTMSHGLTLTKATGIIWYGPPEGNEIYMQANARIERPGKGSSSVVVHIQSTDLERQCYQRLSDKQKLEGVLLKYIKGLS